MDGLLWSYHKASKQHSSIIVSHYSHCAQQLRCRLYELLGQSKKKFIIEKDVEKNVNITNNKVYHYHQIIKSTLVYHLMFYIGSIWVYKVKVLVKAAAQ